MIPYFQALFKQRHGMISALMIYGRFTLATLTNFRFAYLCQRIFIAVPCWLALGYDMRFTGRYYLSCGMGFATMWYVRPAKPQISLRIRAV